MNATIKVNIIITNSMDSSMQVVMQADMPFFIMESEDWLVQHNWVGAKVYEWLECQDMQDWVESAFIATAHLVRSGKQVADFDSEV